MIAGLALALAGTGVAAAQTPGDAAKGKATFMADGCYECHGTVGQGGRATGPRLAHTQLPMDAFVEQLRQPSNEMPPYEPGVCRTPPPPPTSTPICSHCRHRRRPRTCRFSTSEGGYFAPQYGDARSSRLRAAGRVYKLLLRRVVTPGDSTVFLAPQRIAGGTRRGAGGVVLHGEIG